MTVLLLSILACGTLTDDAATSRAVPEPIGLAECAVCGMVVGEQPSPRGQLVYRDGSHDHVCSIEELRALAQQPSARGRPTGVFVEVLPADFDPTSTSTDPLPWSDAQDAWYVFGAPRSGVMGEPVLAFPDRATASRFAEPLGSKPLPWSSLEQTPFHAIPDDAGIPPKP
jgi:nitrous oxide reductase accessory protein NosL